MEFRKELRNLFACAALMGFACSAQALTINMSLVQSVWGNVVIDNPNTLTGVGTNEITWNIPLDNSDHSGFRFDIAAQISTQTNTAFSLGDFTYFNYPAMGENLESADLYTNAALNFAGTIVNTNSLSVPFSLHPVSGNCGNPNCTRDQIKLKGTESIGTFNVGGMQYSLDIMGFMIDGELKNVLHVFDNDQRTAPLIAQISATAIPEPGTFGLLLAGFTALIWNRRRPRPAFRNQNH
jgi:hypothetical protein